MFSQLYLIYGFLVLGTGRHGPVSRLERGLHERSQKCPQVHSR